MGKGTMEHLCRQNVGLPAEVVVARRVVAILGRCPGHWRRPFRRLRWQRYSSRPK
ncbi:MAG: hypothetical protein AAF633_01135 [Chloroflexota bacterium]